MPAPRDKGGEERYSLPAERRPISSLHPSASRIRLSTLATNRLGAITFDFLPPEDVQFSMLLFLRTVLTRLQASQALHTLLRVKETSDADLDPSPLSSSLRCFFAGT